MSEDLVQVAEEISSESEIKEIPIDKPLQDFYHHLSYNERIIFSAKFGDGKTYFLNKFFEEHEDEYEAIRIFPVNYQVADNKDVFELIKKDILIHLLANDLIEDEDFFDGIIYAQDYLLKNGADIILDILSDVPAVKVPVKVLQKSLKKIKRYTEEKKEAKKTNTNIIEDHLAKFEQETGVAEYDSISELITRIIKAIQKKGKKKKVVLVIDDLDRIDPAHLFRILNVLTAHIDREVVLPNEIENGVGNNKFNFNHIVTVFDYNNTERIFHHLYGLNTDFAGYISKFMTGDIFNYSLEKISFDYVIDYLSLKNGIDKKILSIDIVTGAISKLSTRKRLQLIDNFNKEIINEIIEKGGVRFSSVNSFSCFLVLLKRLSLPFSAMGGRLSNIDKECLLNLLGVGLYLGKNISISGENLLFPEKYGMNTNFIQFRISTEKSDALILELKVHGVYGKLNHQVLSEEIQVVYENLSTYVKA